ncbi:MAG: gliding motility-associated C-terminal domain-containing protein [Sphingobacteriales bacterium]|nr:MAG: gliding motility-associated C-terminal domain-containing protein [Sphingobacteriales bacterium]
MNSVGCDSIVTYNITINKKSVFNNPKSICEGDTIFLFGKKYYQNGIYYDTLTNSKNCDSIIITQLEVRETYIFNNIQNICFGTTYNINGKIYNTNGIYYDTLTNIKNCDSIIITNLTINSILSENNNVTICAGSTYTLPKGTVVSTAGTYRDTIKNNLGCDSVVVTNLTVASILSENNNVTICAGSTYTLPKGTIVSTAGTYRDTIKNNQGCDSVVVTNLTVASVLSENNNVTICAGSTYTLPKGTVVSTAGTYRDTIKNNLGCDSVVVTNLTVASILSENNNVTICAGSTYTLPKGIIVSTAGTYRDTIKNNQGCDSVVVTNLTIASALSENNNVTICAGSTYTLPKGTIVSTAGTYRDTIKNNQGCDSVVVTNLTVASVLSENNNITICSGSTYTLPKGTVVSTAGTYRDTIKNNQGCDSVVVTNLTVASILSENNNVTICAGSSYTLPKGTIVSTAGTYKDTIKNNQGCDSVVITKLTISPILSGNNNVTICAGSTYTLPKGTVVSTAGTYRDTIKNNQGCDSVVVTNLTVASVLSENNNVTICAGSTYTLPKGTVVSTAGTYKDTIKNNQGCDSVVVTNLTVASVLSENNNVTICAGSTYTLPKGTVVSNAGTYKDTIKNNQGCDSIVITNLTVASVLSEDNNVTICAGSTYTLPKGNIVSTAGTYRDTIKNNQGCDSVVVTNLTVASILSENNNVTICAGSSYTLPKGTVVSIAGTYNDTIKNNLGCDSVVVTNLTVASVLSENNNVTICAGSTYTLPKGTIVSAAGTYRDTIKNNQGCDSVVVTKLTISPILIGNTSAEFCQGTSYILPSGKSVSNAGTYKDTIKNNRGCDSIVTIKLTSNPIKETRLIDSACSSDNYEFFGSIITSSGVYTHKLQTSKGCDSSIVLNINISPNPTLEIKPNKIKIEKNDTVYLDINSDQTLYNIIWQPADLLNNSSIQNPFAILQDITQFKVQAENEFGCVSNAEIEILINTEDCIYLPNTFTPNGNGINETFRPLGNRIKSITIFRIFDRWGNLVFETNDLNRGWDGTYKGVLLDPNVFIYYIEAICKDGTTSFKKGNVTLLR